MDIHQWPFPPVPLTNGHLYGKQFHIMTSFYVWPINQNQSLGSGRTSAQKLRDKPQKHYWLIRWYYRNMIQIKGIFSVHVHTICLNMNYESTLVMLNFIKKHILSNIFAFSINIDMTAGVLFDMQFIPQSKANTMLSDCNDDESSQGISSHDSDLVFSSEILQFHHLKD